MTESVFNPKKDELGKDCSSPVHIKPCEPIDVNVLNQLDLTPVTELIQGVLDKLELGINVNATQVGTWSIDVNNEGDVADAIADDLDGLTVNVGNFPTELDVNVTNQPIEVTIVNQPIEVDMKTAEPIVVCIENGLVDGVMTTKQALLHVVYNKDGDIERDYLTDLSLNTITGAITECKVDINLGSSVEFCMEDVVFEDGGGGDGGFSFVANDDYVEMNVGETTASIDVILNDTGVIDVESVRFVENGAKNLNRDEGSYVIDDGSISYTPNSNNGGTYSVDYYVNDINGNQASATVTFVRLTAGPV